MWNSMNNAPANRPIIVKHARSAKYEIAEYDRLHDDGHWMTSSGDGYKDGDFTHWHEIPELKE